MSSNNALSSLEAVIGSLTGLRQERTTVRRECQTFIRLPAAGALTEVYLVVNWFEELRQRMGN